MPVDSPTSSNASLTPVPDFVTAVRTSRDFREDKREGVPVGLLKKVEELGITVAHHQNEANPDPNPNPNPSPNPNPNPR